MKATQCGIKARSIFPIRTCVTDAAAVHHIVETFGSPCHVVLPGVFARRVDQFRTALDRRGVSGRIYYAAKANKSDAILAAAAALGIGVDVASRGEAAAALAAGIPGHQLMLTGPHKPDATLRLAIRHGATIAVDSADELARIAAIATAEGARPPVVLRWRPASEATSRFGMVDDELERSVAWLASRADAVRLDGFSTHLSGYDVVVRARAGQALARLVSAARGYGLQPTLIDLGGGWPVTYVDPEEWSRFLSGVGSDDFHAGRMPHAHYPYGQTLGGAAALDACLTHALDDGRTLAELVRDEGLVLAIEPGRALLDRAGASLFRITAVRDRADADYGVVTVDGDSFALSEQWFGSEFLPDPILAPRSTPCGPARAYRACVAGASCLDADMLTWRKLHFDRRPAPGDLLVYANTAGYQMDSNESSFHRRPLPEKVAAWRSAGAWRWCRDSHFQEMVETIGLTRIGGDDT